MKINTSFLSPHTDHSLVDVQFLILHYTGCSLEKTIQIFQDLSSKVSAHFVIDLQGEVYEMVSCLEKGPFRAYHAGQSYWKDSAGKGWNDLNSFSLGVELVNHNGNLFSYTSEQYESLVNLVLALKKKFKSLESADSILGHEHIAGFRGKVDPGFQFDWKYFFKKAYGVSSFPERNPQLPLEIKERFQDLLKNWNSEEKDWTEFNLLMEDQCRHYRKTD